MAKRKPIPKSWVVLGKKITIKLTSNLHTNGNPVWGSYCWQTYTIEIEKDQPVDHQWLTLYHELWHAFEYRVGFARSGASSEIREMLAEGISQFIDEGFVPRTGRK